MKIYIDVSVLTLATFVTGIQRVTREFTLNLIERDGVEVVLLHYNVAKDTYYQINNDAFVQFYRNKIGVKERMVTKCEVPLCNIEKGTIFFDLDAAWMCRLKRSYLLPILKKQGVRIVAHIYDIISITHPQYCLERGVYNFMDYIGAHLQYADQIVVNAQATIDELQCLVAKVGGHLPKCSVVPLGADFKGIENVDESQVQKDVLSATKERPYVLMVGTLEPRKNHKLLLEAYDKGLKEKGYNIIMAGYMGWNMDVFKERLLKHPDYGRGVYHFEGLGDKDVAYLYQHARCLAFLSYMEGFGLPIIEALQRGIPVVAADIPVSREVAGGNCLWFEQDNVAEFLSLFDDENAFERLIENIDIKYLTWEESFAELARALEC